MKVGDSLWLTGVNKPMRVRALHAQNQPTETAHAGSVSRLTSRVMRKKSRLTVATGCLPMRRQSRSHG
ncbi:hypothetical protein ACVXG9_10710 [Escherichia coli]